MADGWIVDQPFQPRLRRDDPLLHGGDRVAGFGHQLVRALLRAAGRTDARREPARAHTPGPGRCRSSACAPDGAEWTPQLMRLLGLDADACR